MIRIVLPTHLRTLARVDGEVQLDVEGPATQRSILDALETRYPMLRGTIRDHVTQQRRAFVRFFACEQDLSHASPDAPLPDAVVVGAEPFSSWGPWPAGSIAAGLMPLRHGHCHRWLLDAAGLVCETWSAPRVMRSAWGRPGATAAHRCQAGAAGTGTREF